MSRKERRGLAAFHRRNFRLVPFAEWLKSREATRAVAIATDYKKKYPWIATDALVYHALTSGMAFKLK